MASRLAAPPLQTPIVELEKRPGTFPGQMTKAFENWLRSLVDRAQVAAYTLKTVALTAQNASIAATTLEPVASGRYRVSYRVRLSQAATTSSSIQIAVTTTEGGVNCKQLSAAYTGNVTNRPQSGVFLIHSDASSPVTFETTYASVGATPMLYELDVVLEAM